jgi:hypothetical protein
MLQPAPRRRIDCQSFSAKAGPPPLESPHWKMKIQFHTGPGQSPAMLGSVCAGVGSFPGPDFLSKWDVNFSKKVAADNRPQTTKWHDLTL